MVDLPLFAPPNGDDDDDDAPNTLDDAPPTPAPAPAPRGVLPTGCGRGGGRLTLGEFCTEAGANDGGGSADGDGNDDSAARCTCCGGEMMF